MKKDLTFTPLSQILTATYAETNNWLVKSLIPLGGLTAFSGSPASMKSYLTQHLALCVSQGVPFLNQFETTARSVLYFDKESRARSLQSRFRSLGATGEPWVEINQDDDFYLDSDEDVERLVVRLKEEQYALVGLIVFDSLIRFHRADENDALKMSKVFANIKKLANCGPAILIIHHQRKEMLGSSPTPNSMRGSSDIYAALDSHLAIAQDKTQGVVSLTHHKLRDGPEMSPFAAKIIRDNDGVPIGFEHVGAYSRDRAKVDETKTAILEMFLEQENEFTREAIYTALGDDVSKALVNKSVTALVVEGLLTSRRGPSNKQFYSHGKNADEAAPEPAHNAVVPTE